MFFAFGDLLLEEEFGPGAGQDGLVGVFKEALMDEVGPAPAAMDPVLVFAAALGDWGPAAAGLDGSGALVAGALAAEGRAKSWCQSGSGAREALPDNSVGLAGEELRDARVVLFERGRELESLVSQHLHLDSGWLDQGQVLRFELVRRDADVHHRKGGDIRLEDRWISRGSRKLSPNLVDLTLDVD